MFSTDKVFIFPCDGIAGDETELRTIPLTGTFAVKFGKHHLDRALHVFFGGRWEIRLDGFLVAPSDGNWREAFGKIWARAEKSNGMLLGRRISVEDYHRLVLSRASDSERGIDLSDAVDLNRVEPPTF